MGLGDFPLPLFYAFTQHTIGYVGKFVAKLLADTVLLCREELNIYWK